MPTTFNFPAGATVGTIYTFGQKSWTKTVNGWQINGSATYSDSLFALTDDGDPTRIAKFQLSNLTTGTTRTLTLPDASGTVALFNGSGALSIPSGGDLFITNGRSVGWGDGTTSIGGDAAADIITVTTNSTERMRVTNAGDIFFGATVAAALEKFRINQTTANPGLFVTNTSTGNGFTLLHNLTNLTDSDCNFVLSQVGAATKFAKIGPSVNVDLQFQTNSIVRGWFGASGLAMAGKASTASGADPGSIEVRATGGAGDGDVASISLHCPGAYASKMSLRADGTLGFGGWSASAWRWYVNLVSGDSVSAGNVVAYSDERLKKDWAVLPENFVDRLAAVKMGTYTRIDTEQRQVGVSAQSLQKLLPEAVTVGQDGDTLTVAYGNAALASVVELAREVVELKRLVAELRGV